MTSSSWIYRERALKNSYTVCLSLLRRLKWFTLWRNFYEFFTEHSLLCIITSSNDSISWHHVVINNGINPCEANASPERNLFFNKTEYHSTTIPSQRKRYVTYISLFMYTTSRSKQTLYAENKTFLFSNILRVLLILNIRHFSYSRYVNQIGQ